MVDELRNYLENIGMDNCDYYSVYIILTRYEPKLFCRICITRCFKMFNNIWNILIDILCLANSWFV